jgi:RimJ/RimL family protein N-acetyltransferase
MMLIRRIRPEDWLPYKELRTEAVRLHPEAFSATYENEQSRTDEQWRERVATNARSTDNVILVADNEDQLVGMVGLYREQGKHHHVATIWGVYVQADYRRHNVGCSLMQDAIAWARQQAGLKKLKLQVNVANEPAHKLYLSCGFQETGRLYQEMNVDGQLCDMILMELFL